MAASTLLQLFSETLWGDIDYMVVDLPPGTGDIPLTLCQQVDVEGVVIVTTPQHLSFADVQKAITMFQNPDLNIPVWGIVENMSWFTPVEHPEEQYFLFGKDGGKTLVEKFDIELLAQIPLVEGLSESADKGNFYGYKQSKMIQDIYQELNGRILSKIEKLEIKSENINFKKEKNKMKIAVPVTSNYQIDDHFGQCAYYSIFTITDKGEIAHEETIKSVEGCGCKSNIASVLAEKGVTIMLAGGIGGGAINVLSHSGIEVIRGCSGDAAQAVKYYIAGNITDSGVSCSEHEKHHSEGSDHVCSN
jgi:predicted Fe-Mo cluster-binding NifX family protein